MPKTGFGNPLQIIANTLAIFIVSQIIAAFVVGAGLSLAHQNLSDAIQNSAAAQFFYVLIAEGLAVLLVLHIIKRRHLSLAAIGFGRRPKALDVSKALLGFGAFYIILILLNSFLSLFITDLNKGAQDVGFNHLHGSLDTAIAFVALVFLPPLGEETLVRGYLYSGLRRSMRFTPALIITSLLFGVAHLQSGIGPGLLWAAGLNTFVLSVVLVYLRQSTGALYAGILVHALNNVLAFGVHFYGLMLLK